MCTDGCAEIRTPLSGMMVIIEMLGDLPNLTVKQQKQYIALLAKTGEHLRRIVR